MLTNRPIPRVALAFAAVMVVNLIGFVAALATGLAGLRTELATGSPVNAPLTFVAVQLLAVGIAVRFEGRRPGTAAAVILVGLCTVGVVSGLGDGSYGNDALTAGDVGIQVAGVAVTAIMAVAAAAQAARGIRRRPAPAAAG